MKARHIVKERYFLVLAIFGLFVFALTYFSRVSYADSDAQLSLLVSQSILEHQTITLDAYRDINALRRPFEFGRTEEINSRLYNLFPTGPSIVALPFVFFANLVGKDMAVFVDNQWLQNLLSATLCVLVFVFIYSFGRCYLNSKASFAIAAPAVLGSALVSTMGTALWNVNFMVLFVVLGLWLISRYETGRTKQLNGPLLGFFLFAAYFCRPTAAVFLAAVLVYLFFEDRTAFLRTAAISFGLFLLFLLWSQHEYGQWLPTYYRPYRVQSASSNQVKIIYGLLFSPSRGLLVYSPIFILTLVGVLGLWKHLWKQPLFWLALTWFGLHLLAVSRFELWWGGHAFGPRLLTEIVPAVIILTVLVWRAVDGSDNRRLKTMGVVIWVALSFASIYTNSFRGLYSLSTTRWNVFPNVDEHREYIFDWLTRSFSLLPNPYRPETLNSS